MPAIDPVRRTHRISTASPGEVFDVVADFPAYPRLFKEISSSRVLEEEKTGAGDRVRVEFKLNLMIPVRYVLDLVCNREAGRIDWTFVEGETITENEGGWKFQAQNSDTIVDYQVALEINAPVPGFILRKVIDGLLHLSLPNMFTAVEREVRKRARVAGNKAG